MTFQDKVVLVTGASSGIGATIAEKFTAEGAKVVVIGRNTSKLAEVSKRCEQLGSKPLVIVADVTSEENVLKAVSETVDKFGKIDVLINNAGAGRFSSILDENAIEAYDFNMNINLRAVVCFTHYAAPHIVKSKGNIVNISSIAGLMIPGPNAFGYCASKAGLDHFGRCIALEFAPKGVRVNTINPGPVKTDFASNSMNIDQATQDKLWESADKLTALGKISSSEEIADLALFLASDKARSITGSSHVVDNGYVLKGHP